MQAERVITSFGDMRQLVRNTAEEPFAAIAHLDCGGTGTGTGFLSRIDDIFVVITAGHCLQEEELVITFGENSPTVQTFHPLKIRANKETFGLPSDYRKKDYSDFGIILLKDQKYFKEKNIYIPLKTESGQRPVMMSGYPGLDKAQHGVPGYPARTQWSIQVTDCKADGAFLRYRDATTGGNSGSPLFVEQNGNYVAVGIHIVGGPDSNKGIRITKAVKDTMCRLIYHVKQRLELEEKQKQEREKEKEREKKYHLLKQEVIRTLNELADELDKLERDTRIAKTSFATAGGASAGAVIGGIILAPVTFGGSLALTVGGLIGGALSGAGALATNVAEKIISSKKLKAAQEAVRKIYEFYSYSRSGPRAAATGTATLLLPHVFIGLNLADIVSNSIKIDKKSPSEVAEQIRAIARLLD